MIEVAIMVEGQNALNWPRWQRIARAVEDLGFVGLYRSDHFTNPQPGPIPGSMQQDLGEWSRSGRIANPNPPDVDALELWASLTWLATNTSRIAFGPLVSPVSFRHPVVTAWTASAVDDLSGGRLQLGMGAGWQAREHTDYGLPLLDVRERVARFEEGLEVVTRLLGSREPVTYEGRYYQLRDATLRPAPRRPKGPPIVIGGNGPLKTLPLTARFADEWNAVFTSPAVVAERNTRLDALVRERGRDPGSVRRSVMRGTALGKTREEIERRKHGRSDADVAARGIVVGPYEAAAEQVARFEAAGAQRIMLQWLDLDDLDGLERLARAVLA